MYCSFRTLFSLTINNLLTLFSTTIKMFNICTKDLNWQAYLIDCGNDKESALIL